jgi:hypothetical protein
MPPRKALTSVLLVLLGSCSALDPSSIPSESFDKESDLFLAHFDSKTDVDDILSIAAVATMLADPRLAGVRYHAVAGAYGMQGGLFIPANELFDPAFGPRWSDAHTDFERALSEVLLLATSTLQDGGNIWIAEAGQSDFSAALIKHINTVLPEVRTKSLIHVVQHSEWNESSTRPENLTYVKTHASYYKIPDGNALGNGTPGFRIGKRVNWQNYIKKPQLVQIWELALGIANKYNGKENRYTNPAIASGGMDFSDVAEACWIFGFNHLADTEDFFAEFASH